MSPSVRAQPFIKPTNHGRLPAASRRHASVDGPERQSGRNASPKGVTPSTIMSPTLTTGSRTEIRLGARAHTTHTVNRAHAPPHASSSSTQTDQDRALDARSLHR